MKKNTLNKTDIIAALLENAVTIVLTAFVIFMIFYRRSFSSWYIWLEVALLVVLPVQLAMVS